MCSSDLGASVVEARFLGSRIVLAQGPVWLARSSHAVLLPVFAVRTKAPDEFAVEIGRPIDTRAGATEPQNHAEATRQFLAGHDKWIEKFPGQWRGWSSLQD